MEYAPSLNRLLRIMRELREKCPWDKKQTIYTLRAQTLEEAYELADAITDSHWQGIKEELGDLLLHIVFYSTIGAEEGHFTLDEVIAGICNKLVSRHPHIYDFVQADDETSVKRNWERLKLREGKASVLSGVPNALPAMVKAQRLQEKTKQVGFEWNDLSEVRAKVDEEFGELAEAIDLGKPEKIEDELGDVFFALVNYARFLNIDPEQALERTNKKFIRRFQQIEERAKDLGKSLGDMTLAEMDAIWNDVKKEERTS